MNTKSGRFTEVNGAARPLATCLAAFLSIALGTSVGFIVPTGVPRVSTVAVAAPPASQAPYFASPRVNQAAAIELSSAC